MKASNLYNALGKNISYQKDSRTTKHSFLDRNVIWFASFT